MILKATDDQFSIDDQGQLLFQDKVGSPLPGAPVAMLNKGDAILTPRLTVLDHPALKDIDADEAKTFLKEKAILQIVKILEPLVALKSAEAPNDAVRGLFDAVYDALGILPREQVESFIAGLDTDTRRNVRQAGITLGPILVFMKALNKPAAVRLRAVLWGIFNDKDLPLAVPNDGMVSQKIEDEQADTAFYQAIGYPLYGPRAVRIDMLDRVICSVYDSADKGKFQAQHQMAEWLGSSIEDLYAVLEAMGHVKIHDPADEEKPEDETAKAEEGDENKEQVKPELATFRLKRGKANEAEKPRSQKPRKPKKDMPSKKQQKQNRDDKKRRVMSAGPQKMNPEDSPFAALAVLKDQAKK